MAKPNQTERKTIPQETKEGSTPQTPSETTSNTGNLEKEQLKSELAQTKLALDQKTQAYEALLNTCQSRDKHNAQLEEENKELRALCQQRQNVPTEVQVLLLSNCVGALKDAQSGGPMDQRNFDACVDSFINQAVVMKDKLLARVLESKPLPESLPPQD